MGDVSRIGITTGIWGRARVWNITKAFLQRNDFIVSVAGSEGQRSKNLCKGFNYIEVKNNPLGNKMNQSCEILKGKVDYVIFIGSDDIFCNNTLAYYLDCIEEGIDFVGFKDCYFYDLISKESIYWAGYRGPRKGEPIGAFKMLSARLLDKLNWQPFDRNRTDSLDWSMMQKLKNVNYSRKLVYMKDYDIIGVDLKTQDSLTKFSIFDNSLEIKQETFKRLPEYNQMLGYAVN